MYKNVRSLQYQQVLNNQSSPQKSHYPSQVLVGAGDTLIHNRQITNNKYEDIREEKMHNDQSELRPYQNSHHMRMNENISSSYHENGTIHSDAVYNNSYNHEPDINNRNKRNNLHENDVANTKSPIMKDENIPTPSPSIGLGMAVGIGLGLEPSRNTRRWKPSDIGEDTEKKRRAAYFLKLQLDEQILADKKRKEDEKQKSKNDELKLMNKTNNENSELEKLAKHEIELSREVAREESRKVTELQSQQTREALVRKNMKNKIELMDRVSGSVGSNISHTEYNSDRNDQYQGDHSNPSNQLEYQQYQYNQPHHHNQQPQQQQQHRQINYPLQQHSPTRRQPYQEVNQPNYVTDNSNSSPFRRQIPEYPDADQHGNRFDRSRDRDSFSNEVDSPGRFENDQRYHQQQQQQQFIRQNENNKEAVIQSNNISNQQHEMSLSPRLLNGQLNKIIDKNDDNKSKASPTKARIRFVNDMYGASNVVGSGSNNNQTAWKPSNGGGGYWRPSTKFC